MTDIIETVNQLEANAAELNKGYQQKLSKMREDFDGLKANLRQESQAELDHYKQEVDLRLTQNFEQEENQLRSVNKTTIETIENEINKRREELTNEIAEKVVKDLWQ